MCFLTVPTAPRSLRVMNINDNTVIVSWMQPNLPNGIITGYLVEYRITGSGVDFTATNITVTFLSIVGLMRTVEYRFRVSAFTEVGVGERSSVVALVGKLKYLFKESKHTGYKLFCS